MVLLIGQFLNPFDAHILRARLEAEGVFAAVVHEHHTYIDRRVALGIGGAKVMVHSDDAEVVKRVLSDRHAGVFAKALEAELGDLDDPCCPACRSTRIKSSRSAVDIAAALLTLFMFAIPLPVSAKTHECEACGARWRT